MFKTVTKVFVIAVMLVSFVGQAISFNTSMPCETSVDALSPNVSELVKHNDSNSIDTDSPEDCCGIECCDLDCMCIVNACSSVEYFSIEVNSTKAAASSEVVYLQQFKQANSISTLRYRPPIFTS